MKSEILAPFNSSMSTEGLDEYQDMKRVAEYYIKQDVMKFQPQAMVFDNAYERDFNVEQDGGVLL